MRRFFLKFALFAAPFILFYGLVGGLALRTGEALPYRAVIDMQRTNPDLVYYLNDGFGNFTYKALNLQDRAPEIILMGSSRSQQFRSEAYTRNPAAFYNAALTGSLLNDIWALYDYIDWDNPPEVLILVLDQMNFRAEEGLTFAPVQINEKTMNSQRLTFSLANMVTTLTDRPHDVTIADLLAARNPMTAGDALGLTAIIFGPGYRYDGSCQLGWQITSDIAGGQASHWSLFEQRTRMFAPSAAVSSANIRRLDDMLQRAAAHDVQVVGVYPPIAPSFYDAMMATGEYSYMTLAGEQLDDLFTGYGFHFLDYTNSALFGGTDEQFLDSYHPSELMSLRIQLDMAQRLPDIFSPYVDTALIADIVREAGDSIYVFPQ